MTLAGPNSTRSAMFGRLAGALDGLGRKLGSQRDRLRRAAAFGPQAEEAALRARLLAFGCAGDAGSAATTLAAELAALANEAATLAGKAEAAAAAGDSASGAIAGHAAALAALVADPKSIADGSVLRRILAPLARTLETLPAYRQEEGAIGTGLARIAEQAGPLAERAGTIAAKEGVGAREEALRLSRDLGTLASEASRLATAIMEAARTPDATAAAVTSSLLGIAPPPPLPPAPVPAQTLPEPPAPRPFGKAVVWGGVSRLT